MKDGEKLRAAVVGATGYAGIELVRLLLAHPCAELCGVSSVSFEGKRLADVYPNLRGATELTLTAQDQAIEGCGVVFAALPAGLSEEIAEKLSRTSPETVLIDLGADFRLRDVKTYEKWYKGTYKYPELHKSAVYCIPELDRDRVGDAAVIANPGCYPTSIALGIAPALKNHLIDDPHIIIDSKSGVTGAGRTPTQSTHFPDANEAFSAYKAGIHRHTPEIEAELSDLAGEGIRVTFVPHLLPVNRGIESTIYAHTSASPEAIRNVYEEMYRGEKFVNVLPDGEYANIRNVRLTNRCDISLHFDAESSTLIVSSVIDNLVKGAAGQAVQNMNLRFGLPEDASLTAYGAAF